MRNDPNSFSNDTTEVQSTNLVAKGDRMEDLQPKAKPTPQSAPQLSTTDTIRDESSAVQLAEAHTVKFTIGKLNDFLQWFATVLEIVLLVRFVFKLIAASPHNPFTSFLYGLTDIILFPFSSIVPIPSRFEWSTLIAMAIYWLIFWAIRRFLRILITSPEEPAT